MTTDVPAVSKLIGKPALLSAFLAVKEVATLSPFFRNAMV
jgi:hypothetical protein